MASKTRERQMARGIREEYREHPEFGKRGARQIVEDHLKRHPFMYRR